MGLWVNEKWCRDIDRRRDLFGRENNLLGEILKLLCTIQVKKKKDKWV